MGMTLIATEAQFVEGRFTGDFQTKNNNGEEKVKRIKQVIGDQKFDKIIAFGDTSGDKPMLAFAHESHYRFFN
jgi:phosphoserine phosphatase